MSGTSKPVATRLSYNGRHSPDVAQGFSWHDARPVTFYTMNNTIVIIMRCVRGVGAFSFAHLIMILIYGATEIRSTALLKNNNNQYNGYLLAIACVSLLLFRIDIRNFCGSIHIQRTDFAQI